jgi:hypothetical protein
MLISEQQSIFSHVQELMLSSSYTSQFSISLGTSMLTLQCRKLLTRNTYADPTFTVKGKAKGIKHTKADILNLISSDAVSLAKIGLFFPKIFRCLVETMLGCAFVWYLLGMCIHNI